MTQTWLSKTSSMTLVEVTSRLAQKDDVDGLILIGSYARRELRPSSDYDLVILMSRLPVPIDMGLTYIDRRLTDLVFITVEDMNELLEGNKPINPYTLNGRTFLRLEEGEIMLDRSGRLERARQKVQRGVPLQLLSARENHSRWWMMNYHLRHTKRMLGSNDPVYATAVDLRLIGMRDFLMLDYFNFRNLVWKGEKEAVTYWTSHDPQYLGLFKECIGETDTRRKLHLYEELAAKTADPLGGVWQEGTTALKIRPEAEAKSDLAEVTRSALDFWETLVEAPSDESAT